MARKEEEQEVSIPDPLPPIVTFTHSESLKSIAPALLAAQKKMKNPAKSSDNPFFHSKYADLEACMKEALRALNSEDILVTQLFVPTGYGIMGLTTLAVHKSGEYIGGTATLPDDRGNAQGYGSAATYARRYGVVALLGLVAEDDDDGNAASGLRGAGKGASKGSVGGSGKISERGGKQVLPSPKSGGFF